MVSAWGCLGHTAFAVWSKGSAEAMWGWRWQLLFVLPGPNLPLVKRQELPKSVRIWNSPV